jgi:hypothetical protein
LINLIIFGEASEFLAHPMLSPISFLHRRNPVTEIYELDTKKYERQGEISNRKEGAQKHVRWYLMERNEVITWEWKMAKNSWWM